MRYRATGEQPVNDYRFEGEPISGPGAALRRWVGPRGERGWALVYADPWVRHPLLASALTESRSYLESPGSDAVMRLVGVDRGVLRFHGDGVLLAELTGSPRGERAALELFARGCRAIADALAEAPDHVPSHGALSPWRLVLVGDGSVRLLGMGLPQVEALAWLDEEVETATAESLRYFPSERLEDRGEDARSDLYALALCAAELAAGRPVLRGTLNTILDTVYDGRVAAALEGVSPRLSPEAVDLLATAVAHAITDRPRDLAALADIADDLAERAAGPGLDSLAPSLIPGVEDGPTDAPPDSARTELVALSPELLAQADRIDVSAEAPRPLADTLITAQGKTPPPPPPEPEDEPELTELAPGLTDEAPLPPGVPYLAAGADLAAIRNHAGALVSRAELLAALAGRAAESVRAGRGVSDADRAAARDDADKARKAATTARSSAGLLELDDDAAEARVTVELVARAEQQAEVATLRAQALAAEVIRRGRAARAAQEAQRRSEVQAEQHADLAAAAAEAADAAASELEAEREGGGLGHPDAIAALAEAWSACERADLAAAEAEAALAALRAGEGHAATLERAREAQAAAERARGEVLRAVARARDLEREGAGRLAADARGEVDRARDAVRDATGAEQRAQESARLVPGDEVAAKEARAARAARATAIGHAEAAAAAATQAAKAERSGDAAAALHQARAAADAAASAATEAREAADRVAHRAGAAAERAARLASLRERGASSVDGLTRFASRLEETLAAARAELGPVRAAGARAGIAAAEQGLAAFRDAVEELRTAAAEVVDTAGLAALEERIGAVRASVDVESRLAQARRAAADELRALEAERARAAALAEARERANRHASRCKELADQASRQLADRIAALADFGDPEVAERCARAQDIVEIAVFQAGEAAQSAKWADQETQPDEAHAHADTAGSFETRITLDLPEADALVAEAETLATRLRSVLDACRNTAAALRAEAEGIRARTAAGAEEAQREASALDGGAVERARNLLAEALGELVAANGAVTDAVAAVQRARKPDDAAHRVDVAREAAVRVAGLEANVRDRIEALRRIAASARETAQAVNAARERARAWSDQADEARVAAERHATGARDLVASLGVSGDAVRAALDGAVSAARDATTAAARALAASQAARQAEEAPQAERASDQAQESLARAERARAAAEEAARRTETAARTEARERDATRARKIQAARDVARAHAETAREAADRLASRHEDVLVELRSVESAVATAEAESAGRDRAACEAAAREAEAARDLADATTSEVEAEAAARQTQLGAMRAVQLATQASATLDRARDHARAAAAEADALSRVVAEAQDAVRRTREAVDRAKEEARAILQLKIGLEAKKELAATIREEIQVAEKMLAKVQATAPLASETTDLGTAQALLATCRASVSRAEQRADAVRELVSRAAREVAEEAERRAAALTAARSAARQPAEQALEAASRVKGWLDEANRAASGIPAAAPVLGQLAAANQALGALAAGAQAAIRSVEELDDTAALRRTTDQLATELGDVARLLAEAERARSAITTAVITAQRREQALRVALKEVEGIRDHAREVASRARAVVDELDTWVGALGDPGPLAQATLQNSERAAQNARAAVEALDALVERATGEPDAIRTFAQDLMQRAIAGLEAVVKGDAAAREAATDHQAELAEIARQEEAARAAAEAEAEAAQRGAAQRKLDERSGRRTDRVEERRQRFLSRRGIAPEPSEAASESEVPLELVEPGQPIRRVPKWDRGKTQATEGTTKPPARPRPSAIPEASRKPAVAPSSGADALLQRLRDRQNRRDGDDG